MALGHADVGTALSKSEWESTGTGAHVLASQAAGDIIYASTTTALSRLAIGTANQVLATNAGASAPEWVTSVASATLAATVTVIDSTDTSSFIAMFDSATGSLAVKTDAGLTYNAGTGMLTATGLTGPLTGNASGTAATVTGAAQAAITSLGTLTTLTVDDVNINGKVITMTGDTSDTAVFTAGTNGTLDIVTTDAAGTNGHIQITADGTVDIDSAGALTLDSGGAINLEPVSGSAILLDGVITVDAGVVTPVATAHDAAGTAVSISAGTTTAGTTDDIAGGALTIQGGRGKGTGAGGDIIFQTANAAGSTASSLNSLATALTISDDLSSTFVGEVKITKDKLLIGGTAVTTTAAELNVLDAATGLVTADLTKLAGVNATAAEINIVDGSAKSTSSITIADDDAFIIIDGTTTKQIPASDISAYAGGGLQFNEYDMWALTADTTTEDNTPLDTNLTRFVPNNAMFEYITADSGMEKEAGGIFKFPSTGKWEVIVQAQYSTGSSTANDNWALMQTTHDNSTWQSIAIPVNSGEHITSTSVPVLIHIDDVENDKVRLSTLGVGTLVAVNATTAQPAFCTGIIFKKMGAEDV